MKVRAFIPGLPEISREAFSVLAGALIAAFIVGQFPAVKAWIRDQWGDTPR